MKGILVISHEKKKQKKERFSSEVEYQRYLEETLDAQEKPTKSIALATVEEGEKHRTSYWLYKQYIYIVYHDKCVYNDEEIKFLIYDDYDKERRRFERLKNKFAKSKEEREEIIRPRIPENIRIKVWQRDDGKCARCGSREKLEYDHIVPISKGGSNTLRNIELLCEECNRKKGSKIS